MCNGVLLVMDNLPFPAADIPIISPVAPDNAPSSGSTASSSSGLSSIIYVETITLPSAASVLEGSHLKASYWYVHQMEFTTVMAALVASICSDYRIVITTQNHRCTLQN